MTKNEKAAPQKSTKSENSEKKPNLAKKPTLTNNARQGKSEDKSKNANWSLRLLLLLLIFMAGAATGLYFMPALKERLPFVGRWLGDGPSADITAINRKVTDQQTEIASLSTKSAELESRLNQISATPAPEIPEDLIARITALEESLIVDSTTVPIEPAIATDTSQSGRIDLLLSRMSQLEASFVPLSKNMIDGGRADSERQALISESAGLKAKIANLESRLERVEQVASKDNSGILLNLKIAELKRKIISGEPYGQELETVSDMINNSSLAANSRFNDAVSYLSENALTGITTADQLRRNFNALIPDLLSAEGMDGDASWWQNTLKGLKNMVTVRKTDGTSFDDSGLDGLISEIERWLESGSFKQALDIINELPEQIKSLLQVWQDQVQSWLQSEAAINDLETIAAEDYLKPPKPPEVEAEL